MNLIKRITRKFTPEWVLRYGKLQEDSREVQAWEQQGKPVPVPHGVKQRTIAHYQTTLQVQVLVETGTYKGDMVYAQLDKFERIYSIELGEELWKRAVQRFEKFPQVQLWQGDSGQVLHTLVPQLSEKAIFWLDGHYSGGITAMGKTECPIFEELDAILNSKFGHLLLIDDARLFTGEGDYPTLQELKEFINQKREYSQFLVQDDIIQIKLK